MKFFLVSFCFLSLFFISCKQNIEKQAIPSDLLSRDTLILVLVDIHLADAMVTTSNLKDNEKRDFSYSCYKAVFEKYNIKKGRFDNSLKYYSRDPKYLDVIYEDVLVEMSELEGKSMVNDVFKDAANTSK